MKHLLLAVSAAFAFTACSEENISISPDLQSVGQDEAHIFVYVAVEDLAANNGGCAEGTYVHEIEGAEVFIYYLDEERPISADAILAGLTDKKGMIVFDDLPQGNFKVEVITKFGTEHQEAKTKLGKLTKIFVRF